MNPDPLEQHLRSLKRRPPPTEFLERTLSVALTERRQIGNASPEKPSQMDGRNNKPLLALLSFVPRPIRWPLAACWLLSLLFRMSTPETIPASTAVSVGRMTPPDPKALLVHLKNAERLAHELLDQHHGPIPPL